MGTNIRNKTSKGLTFIISIELLGTNDKAAKESNRKGDKKYLQAFLKSNVNGT